MWSSLWPLMTSRSLLRFWWNLNWQSSQFAIPIWMRRFPSGSNSHKYLRSWEVPTVGIIHRIVLTHMRIGETHSPSRDNVCGVGSGHNRATTYLMWFSIAAPADLMWVYIICWKIDVLNSITCLNHTFVFEWYVIGCSSKNGYKNSSTLFLWKVKYIWAW